MADSQTNMPRQLSFDDLERQLDQKLGEAVKFPISPDDIGGELLAILSKGLYTNPLDCIREYVQNSVDAQATELTIKITGNSVIIHDNGYGMDLAELLQARQFGLSGKSLTEHVGFRGIGIYSAFDLCRRLRISSTKEDDPHLHVLVFDFSDMKLELEKDKDRKLSDGKISLLKLLSEYTSIKRELLELPTSRKFTIVELQDISDTHIKQLSNRTELRRYLLQNLPIDFADDFDYRKVINDKLRLNVRGYNPIKITLQTDGLPDEIVVREAISNLQTPSYGLIVTSSGQQVAYYWACMNNDRGRIAKGKVPDDELNYEGFVYKVKGFTIGNRQKLRPMFSRKPQLYPWYTGEIYVLDPNVIPNTERDDFETNQAKRALELAVRDKLTELETEVINFQARGVADERIERYEKEITEISAQVEANTQASDFETFSRLDDIKRDLLRQKRDVSSENKPVAEDLKKRVDRLQKQLRKEVDSPTPEADRRKRAAKKEQVAKQIPLPVITPPPQAPIKTLPSLLQDLGWEIDGEIKILVELIQSSLEDVLSVNSPTYSNLLNDIEARLDNIDLNI